LRLTRSEKGLVVAVWGLFNVGSLNLLGPDNGTKPFSECVVDVLIANSTKTNPF
jgi:hypothetical protein